MWIVKWFIKGNKFSKRFKNGIKAREFMQKKWIESDVEGVQSGFKYYDTKL